MRDLVGDCPAIGLELAAEDLRQSFAVCVVDVGSCEFRVSECGCDIGFYPALQLVAGAGPEYEVVVVKRGDGRRLGCGSEQHHAFGNSCGARHGECYAGRHCAEYCYRAVDVYQCVGGIYGDLLARRGIALDNPDLFPVHTAVCVDNVEGYLVRGGGVLTVDAQVAGERYQRADGDGIR